MQSILARTQVKRNLGVRRKNPFSVIDNLPDTRHYLSILLLREY